MGFFRKIPLFSLFFIIKNYALEFLLLATIVTIIIIIFGFQVEFNFMYY